MKTLSQARVAIVHEWPVRYAGSEKVVAECLRLFPEASLFALVHDAKALQGTPLEGVPVKTSFIQSLPKSRERYQSYLPLMPMAVEQFDLRGYDIILSSNHAVAKGVLTRADQLHISYMHTPIRYAWDLYLDYLTESGLDRGMKSLPARLTLHYLRLWDTSAANRVDAFLANSAYVARRVEKLYRRQAQVLHPPVEVEGYEPGSSRKDYYVAVSRFVPYKRMNLIIEAFTRMEKPLVVIGEGSEFAQAQRIAGPTVKLLGYQPDAVVRQYLQQARAFIFAAEEDFGIAPVEAQAAGCPVIAFGKGGARETVVGWPEPGSTGMFFEEQTPESLEAAVRLFEDREKEFDSETCRRNAERFGPEHFLQKLESIVEELWRRFQRGESLERTAMIRSVRQRNQEKQ